MPRSITIRTLLEATDDVIYHQHRPGGAEMRMGTRDVQYSVGGNVILIVWPGSQMTCMYFRAHALLCGGNDSGLVLPGDVSALFCWLTSAMLILKCA